MTIGNTTPNYFPQLNPLLGQKPLSFVISNQSDLQEKNIELFDKKTPIYLAETTLKLLSAYFCSKAASNHLMPRFKESFKNEKYARLHKLEETKGLMKNISSEIVSLSDTVGLTIGFTASSLIIDALKKQTESANSTKSENEEKPPGFIHNIINVFEEMAFAYAGSRWLKSKIPNPFGEIAGLGLGFAMSRLFISTSEGLEQKIDTFLKSVFGEQAKTDNLIIESAVQAASKALLILIPAPIFLLKKMLLINHSFHEKSLQNQLKTLMVKVPSQIRKLQYDAILGSIFKTNVPKLPIFKETNSLLQDIDTYTEWLKKVGANIRKSPNINPLLKAPWLMSLNFKIFSKKFAGICPNLKKLYETSKEPAKSKIAFAISRDILNKTILLAFKLILFFIPLEILVNSWKNFFAQKKAN